MNRLTIEKRAQVISALVEGSSLRSIVRMAGVAMNTILKLLADIGMACSKKVEKPRALCCPALHVVQLRPDSPNAVGHSDNGGWNQRPCMDYGGNCSAVGLKHYPKLGLSSCPSGSADGCPKTDVFATLNLGVPQAVVSETCRRLEGEVFATAPATKRRAVRVLTLNWAEIVRQEAPWARSATIRKASAVFRGRPSFLPFALAFRSPARTRSAIRLRSSSATAPRTVKIILPVGVEVSTCSDRLTNSMPSALNVSSARSR